MVARLIVDELLADAIVAALNLRKVMLIEEVRMLEADPDSVARSKGIDEALTSLHHTEDAHEEIVAALAEGADYPTDSTFERFISQEVSGIVSRFERSKRNIIPESELRALYGDK